MIVVAATSKTGDNVGGIANLKIGDEAVISQWNTALHVLINALSTMLLAGSNYTMQVLSSPTRQDVDAAHARGQWLDIGVLSPRNLRLIPRKRAALWYTYNASIFKVVTSSEYQIFTVDVASDEWNRINSTTDVGKSTNGSYSNLGGGKWTTVYDNEYISVHGDLYLAIDRVAFDTTQAAINPEAINITSTYLDYNVTGNQRTLRDLTSESASWIRFRSQPDPTIQWMSISAHVVEAAAEKRKSPPSRVQISLYFLIIVAVFNLLKLSVMAYVLITDRSAYLVTLGDAAASFLEHPDPHTTGICALGREELLITLGHPSKRPFSTPEEKSDLDLRVKGPLYTSSGHWGWGIGSDDNVPFGSDGTTATATLWNAWLANVPQLILSFFYLSVNMICTAMSGANEWNHLAKSKKVDKSSPDSSRRYIPLEGTFSSTYNANRRSQKEVYICHAFGRDIFLSPIASMSQVLGDYRAVDKNRGRIVGAR
ncbi:hypothetical protein J4E86_011725 [Alternaria arbusti]|uniref:uncharacterized protein n=1 Tax=Alternaria arbusti TaxID=232088 RepID=UPI002221069B|nr:uncharacterized protein J4E86_011725 [Alternaria arbusti]KAI4929197.1 hypothetical protein J4E86_011725 [Alternaria arbusti]